MLMNIITISFLVIISVLYCISMRLVWCDRYYIAFHYRPESSSDNQLPVAYVKDNAFIPGLIGGILIILWCLIWPYPYLTIQFLTPSYATSNWLWTTFAAFLVSLPAGIVVGFVIMMLTDARPLGKIMLYLSFSISIIAMLLSIWMLFMVYSPWVIWIPILSGTIYCLIMKKNIPYEEEQYEKYLEEEEKKRIEHQKWYREYINKRRMKQAAENAARERSLASSGWVPQRYRFNYDGNWYEVTQDRPTSNIHFIDQHGHRWEKMGSSWKRSR